MTQDATSRWDLPLLYAGQAQKEIFHNEALARIDMLLHGAVESADVSAAPTSPVAGTCWIVADGADGDWAGRDSMIACWTEGGWRFVAPEIGLAVHAVDRGHAMIYDGSGWVNGAIRGDGVYVGGQRVIGPQAAAIADPAGGSTIDSQARDAVSAILMTLREHGLIAA